METQRTARTETLQVRSLPEASVGFPPLCVSATMAALSSFSDKSIGNRTGDDACAQETNDGARVEDRARAVIGFFARDGSSGNLCGTHNGPGRSKVFRSGCGRGH